MPTPYSTWSSEKIPHGRPSLRILPEDHVDQLLVALIATEMALNLLPLIKEFIYSILISNKLTISKIIGATKCNLSIIYRHWTNLHLFSTITALLNK